MLTVAAQIRTIMNPFGLREDLGTRPAGKPWVSFHERSMLAEIADRIFRRFSANLAEPYFFFYCMGITDHQRYLTIPAGTTRKP